MQIDSRCNSHSYRPCQVENVNSLRSVTTMVTTHQEKREKKTKQLTSKPNIKLKYTSEYTKDHLFRIRCRSKKCNNSNKKQKNKKEEEEETKQHAHYLQNQCGKKLVHFVSFPFNHHHHHHRRRHHRHYTISNEVEAP